MAKKNDDPKKRKEIQDELNELLKGFSSEDGDIADKELSEVDEIECPIDFEELEKEYEEKAKTIIKAFLKTFVDEDMIDDRAYLDAKSGLDEMDLSTIFYQIKTIKLTINAMMRNIMTGNHKARDIEVMGQLQTKLTDLIKTRANYFLFLEDSYRKTNQDYVEKQSLPAPQNVDPAHQIENHQYGDNEEDYYISAGTKSIIESLPASNLKNDDAMDNDLTDPNKKTDLMTKNGIEFTDEDEDENDSLDLDEMI